jgi:hypothetical protein
MFKKVPCGISNRASCPAGLRTTSGLLPALYSTFGFLGGLLLLPVRGPCSVRGLVLLGPLGLPALPLPVDDML